MKIRLPEVVVTLLATLLLLPPATAADATGSDSVWHTQVTEALAQHLNALQQQAEARGDRFHWEISSPDARLHFSACSRLPEIQRRSAANSGQVTLAAHCTDRGGYHVPVRVQITQHRKVAVLTRPLPRGTRLAEDMIEYRERDLGGLTRGHFTADDPVLGMVLRRSLPSGTVLHPGQVSPPMVVQRGDEVMIVAENSAIEVRMKGVAMNAGRVGEQITVRNSHSKRLLQARVAAVGEVRVAF